MESTPPGTNLMRSLLLAAALAVLAACGGDSTGPNSSSDLAGKWNYTATNLNGSGLSCNIAGVTVSLNQTGSTFTGTTAGGTLTCAFLGTSETDSLGTGFITNGQVSGNAVQFDIGSSAFHHAGTRAGNSVTGTLTAMVDDGSATVVLTGTFALVKQ